MQLLFNIQTLFVSMTMVRFIKSCAHNNTENRQISIKSRVFREVSMRVTSIQDRSLMALTVLRNLIFDHQLSLSIPMNHSLSCSREINKYW